MAIDREEMEESIQSLQSRQLELGRGDNESTMSLSLLETTQYYIHKHHINGWV